jgi:cobalt-zinc-cadmium efflux system outer membrane protein
MKSVTTWLAAMLVVAVLTADAASAQTAAAQPPLRLSDLYQNVRAKHPRLAAARALVDAKRAMEAGAGLPPDPQVQVGAMNLSLPSLSADMPSSMAPSVEVMQMLPIGKLGVSKRIAEQSTGIARAAADESWWEVRAEAAMAFYEVYQADRELAIMKETLRLMQDFRKVAQAMYAAGEGRQADVLRAGVEVARMHAEIKRMEAMRTGAGARLNAALNQPADVAAGAPQLPDLPLQIPAIDTLRAWAEATRPMLARGRTEIEQAASRLQLARKEIIPDFSIAVQYGQRRAQLSAMDPALPPEYGTERMGSVMLGFSVPLFAGKRQLKMREEAEAMRQMAQADLARMRTLVDARLIELGASLERSRTLMQLYRTEVLPQAEAAAQSAFSSYRVGQVDFMTLVDAQVAVNKYKQELAALQADYGAGIAELEMTIGRELPLAAALTAEGN